MELQLTKGHFSSSLANKQQQQSLLKRSHKLFVMQCQWEDDDNLALQQKLPVPLPQKHHCVLPL